MNRQLRVGIVGFGGSGSAQYWHFESLEGCDVVAICDPKQAGLDRARELPKTLLLTDDFAEFLESGIDVVAICSPDRTHADYMTRSLQAGKHTLCEKPLTDSIDGCRKIIQAHRQFPEVVAAVQHQMRFLPVHGKMKELIKNGELGAISYIEGYYVHNVTKRAKLYDNWRFEDKVTPLLSGGGHFVDLLRWLLDDEVVEIMGMANNIAFPEFPESDLNVALLRFRSGVLGKVVTALGAGRPQDHSVRVYGSEKCIENNLLFAKDGSSSVFARPLLIHSIHSNLSYKRRLQSIRDGLKANLKSVMLGQMFEQLAKVYKPHSSYSVNSYPLRLYEHGFAVACSISDFVDAICMRRRPKCSVVDAARTVATCLAGVEAYRTGRSVSVQRYWVDELEI